MHVFASISQLLLVLGKIGCSKNATWNSWSAVMTFNVHGERACFNQLLKKEEQVSHGELGLHQELQQREAEAKDAKRGLSEAQGKLQALQHDYEESLRLNSDHEIERWDEEEEDRTGPLCVHFACSPCVSAGSRRVLWLPPMLKVFISIL